MFRDDTTNDDDIIGTINFSADNSVSDKTIFASMFVEATDVTDGEEDSTMYLSTMTAGLLSPKITLNPSGMILANGSILLDEITLPSTPAANKGLVYLRDVSGTTTPFFMDSTGTETSMIAVGGGSQTPVGQDIDYNGFDAFDFGQLRFRTGTASGASTEAWMSWSGVNLETNVPSGDGYIWFIANLQKLGIANTTINAFEQLDMNTHKIIDVVDPTNAQDAATKNYVDSAREGLQDHSIWITHETTEFDFEVYHSNSKSGVNPLSTRTMTQDIIWFVPIFLGQRARLDKIAIDLKSAASGVFTTIAGIYTNRTDGQNYPETRLDTDSQVQAAAVGVKSNTGFAEDLEPGLYWLAVLNTTENLTVLKYLAEDAISVGFNDDTALDAMLGIVGYTSSGPDTSLPATADDDMTAITLDPPAIFAKFLLNPN